MPNKLRREAMAKITGVEKESTAETVYLCIKSPELQLLYHTEKYDRDASGNLIMVEPVEWIKFSGGLFSTTDPEVIKYIEGQNAFKTGLIMRKADLDAKTEKARKDKTLAEGIAALNPEEKARLEEMLGKVKKE